MTFTCVCGTLALAQRVLKVPEEIIRIGDGVEAYTAHFNCLVNSNLVETRGTSRQYRHAITDPEGQCCSFR